MTVRPLFRALVFTSISLLPALAQEPFSTPAERDRAYDFCRTLATEFRGRLTGDTGYTDAARWIADSFRQWGIKSFNDSPNYLQSFPAPYSLIDRSTLSFTGSPDGTAHRWELTPGKDFLPMLFSDTGAVTSPVAFVGWGIHAPQLGYDDYAGVDVKGKIVLCFRGVPNHEDSVFQYFDEHRTRMQTAKDMGARALLYIYEEPIANPNGDVVDGLESGVISFAVADSLFKEQSLTAAGLENELSHSRTPHSFALNASGAFAVAGRHFPKGIGYNVAGWIEGSDPALRDQFIVIGAHLDHCGPHMGLVFQGANDNGSGSAVVMAIAEAMAKQERPKRSVAFVLFGGEEMGLLGSKYFAAHLPGRMRETTAMLNFDMVGEGDGAHAGYSARDPWLKDLLTAADADVHTLRGTGAIRRVGVRSSDFAPFFALGVPCLSFSSNGPHLSYHQSGDTIYRINPDMLADVAYFGLRCARAAANR